MYWYGLQGQLTSLLQNRKLVDQMKLRAPVELKDDEPMTGIENGTRYHEKPAKDGLQEITGMVEKPKPEEAPSTLALIGRYVLLPEVFDHLDRHEKGAGGEIQLTDAMAKMIGNKPFHAMTYTGQRYDCGSRIGFLEANVGVALNRADTAAETRALLARMLKG